MTFPHGVHRKEYCYEEGRFDVKQVGMGIPNRIVPLPSVLAAHHKFYTAAKPNGPDISSSRSAHAIHVARVAGLSIRCSPVPRT